MEGLKTIDILMNRGKMTDEIAMKIK